MHVSDLAHEIAELRLVDTHEHLVPESLWLENGRAAWYRNRWIRTEPFVKGLSTLDSGLPMGGNNQSNVSPIYHAGRLLTSGEVGFPYEVDPDDLSTVGVHDFAGALTHGSFTAHAKIDPVTTSIRPIDTVISMSEKPCSREWRTISLPFAFSPR